MHRVLAIAALAMSTLVCTSSFAATTCDSNALPGLVAGSYPCFVTDVNLTWTPVIPKPSKKNPNPQVTKGTLSASYISGGKSTLFKSDTQFALITDTIFSFSIDLLLDKNTNMWTTKGGSLSIDGITLGATKSSNLMSAKFTGVWGYDYGLGDHNLIGFNTTKIRCSKDVNTYVNGCTTDEVLYFDIGSAFINPQIASNLAAVAYTSVPLPTAVWLFGSGLLGLVGISRRKKVV
jgi:hypothetical protein